MLFLSCLEDGNVLLTALCANLIDQEYGFWEYLIEFGARLIGCNERWLSSDFGNSKLRLFLAFVSDEYYFLSYALNCAEKALI